MTYNKRKNKSETNERSFKRVKHTSVYLTKKKTIQNRGRQKF